MKLRIIDEMTAETLKALRLEANLTQAELASATGIAQPNIAAMEAGKRAISKASATRIEAGIDQAIALQQARIEAAVQAAFNRKHLAELRRKANMI